jgi:hypothetical protein
MPPELRMAGIAAAALAVSLILPWYQKSAIPPGRSELVQENLSALAVFTFVEAAVLLVAAGVLFLLWARLQGKAFHLPGGDGFVISVAGGWAMALLVWRLFDKPDVDGAGATVGIQWGIFAAMVAAGALIAAGARVRAAHRPEPPNPAEDLSWEEAAPRPRRRETDRREPRDATAVTELLRDRPGWQGEPPDAPGRAPRRERPGGGESGAARDRGGEGRGTGGGESPPSDRLF